MLGPASLSWVSTSSCSSRLNLTPLARRQPGSMSDSPSPFDSGKRAHTSDDESYPTDGQAASTSSKAASSLGSKAAKPLNRTSRACNACRRQSPSFPRRVWTSRRPKAHSALPTFLSLSEMRCLEAETGCCTRCRKAGLPCTFEKPLREAQVGEE